MGFPSKRGNKMKAFKIIDGEGYIYQVTEAKPTEETRLLIEEQHAEEFPFESFTIEEVKAEWAITDSGRSYIKEV
jgi:hypothetical protein